MPSTTTFWAKVEKDLQRDEGWRGQEYVDTVGVPTIGYGFNVLENRKLIEKLTARPYNGRLAPEEGAKILAHLVRVHWEDLTEALPWVEDQPEDVQRILLNMCYNLGVTRLCKFRETLALIRGGAYADAADRLLTLPYAKQTGQRAVRLAMILRAVV
jgi:lysozyme